MSNELPSCKYATKCPYLHIIMGLGLYTAFQVRDLLPRAAAPRRTGASPPGLPLLPAGPPSPPAAAVEGIAG